MPVAQDSSEAALARAVHRTLGARGLTLAVAEGTTGGRIGERLVRYAGASVFFKGAVVTYSYQSRTALLGIPRAFVARHGGVSEEVVRAMAEAVRRRLGADVGLASSGIAGPTGGTAGKPVGLVWLAVATAERTVARRHVIPHATRLQVQSRATAAALRLLLAVVGGRGEHASNNMARPEA